MSQKDKILKIVKKNKGISSTQISEIIDISRQMAHRYLSKLIAEGQIHKEGQRRAAKYFAGPGTSSLPTQIKVVKKIKDLREDEVFDELSKRIGLKKSLNTNAWQIAYYAFTEMLNNAIDHSNSSTVRVVIELKNKDFKFTVRDEGIGIFNRLQKGFKLDNHLEAIEYLFKGKQTTFPERHSGQGIYFTSRIADVFKIRSSALLIEVNNDEKDQIIKKVTSIKGTEVIFQVKKQTRKQIEELFRSYSNDDYEFDKNVIRPKLNSASSLVSRSQARKLLIGMEKFDRLIFDFQNISGIGQAFADEIFRVYKKRFPKVQVTYINANETVEFMIQRSRKTK